MAALAAAVLAVHALVLLVAPELAQPASRQSLPQAFVTRSIAPAPPPVAPVPAAPPQPAPKPRAAPPVTPVAQARTAPEPLPEPQPPRVEAVATTTPPPPAAPAPPPAAADAAPSQSLAIPDSARMRYDVAAQRYGLTVHSSAQLLWRHDGRQYEAVMEAGGGVFPRRVQRSTGLITDDGLAPLRFSDRNRSETAAHFERDKGKVTFSNNKPDAPLEPGMQDRLSVLLQLAALVGGAPQRYAAGTSITVPVAGTSEAEHWLFTIEGEESLDLPAGPTRALKLQRLPRREYDVKVELWLAPGLAYAPVRLRLTNPNGDSLDQRWAGADRP